MASAPQSYQDPLTVLDDQRDRQNEANNAEQQAATATPPLLPVGGQEAAPCPAGETKEEEKARKKAEKEARKKAFLELHAGGIEKKPKLDKAQMSLQEEPRAYKEAKKQQLKKQQLKKQQLKKQQLKKQQPAATAVRAAATKTSGKQVAPLLFSHLPPPQCKPPRIEVSVNVGTSSAGDVKHTEPLHPAIIQLGVQYAEGRIVGANARCFARLAAYATDRIDDADRIISGQGERLIVDGDVILTYARSHAVEQLLLLAHHAGKRFRVIVLDSRPRLEGRELLRRLSAQGLHCSYALLAAAPYVAKEATKMMVGAAAMLHNGSLVSRVGTAAVACVAKAARVPLLVCCETYKFIERVQLDSFCANELGDPEVLVRTGRPEGDCLADWQNVEHLKLLHLTYDVTPMNYIDMVITEVGNIPPTSVPVVIREYRQDL